jgi:hypothetical protein
MRSSTGLSQYIFVTDQSRVFFTQTAPTPEDLAYAEVGMVVIVRVADAHYYGRECDWLPVPAGRLGCAELDGEETPLFHSLPDLFDKTEQGGSFVPHDRF